MLINHERVAAIWAKPHVIGIVQFIINSQINTETGTTPFEFLFGSLDAEFLRLPNPLCKKVANKFIGELNENLKDIRQAAWEVISKMKKMRLREVPNQYQIGDFILLDDKEMGRKRSKLAPRFSGPYVVDQTYKADLTVRHVVTGEVKVVHMEIFEEIRN
jgi:hypothetical protein